MIGATYFQVGGRQSEAWSTLVFFLLQVAIRDLRFRGFDITGTDESDTRRPALVLWGQDDISADV